MIFFTAGEAVKRVEETWKPYLDGRGTRDEALAALVALTAAPPRRRNRRGYCTVLSATCTVTDRAHRSVSTFRSNRVPATIVA